MRLSNIFCIAALMVVATVLFGANATAKELSDLNELVGINVETRDISYQAGDVPIVIEPTPDFVIEPILNIPVPDIFDIFIPRTKTIPEPTLEPTAAPTPASTDAPDGRVCAQVVTLAENPATGERKEFPTPCDVPKGWVVINPQPINEPDVSIPGENPPSESADLPNQPKVTPILTAEPTACGGCGETIAPL